MTNSASTGARKKENLHALYSILEYCEETYLCRRKMQLQFLGEGFDARNCGKMCDNCRQGLQVVEQDYSSEALKILEFIRVN